LIERYNSSGKEAYMAQVCIRGVGCYAPEARLTNAELVARLGVTDDYIVKLTGVRERRRAAPDEATSDMAVRAAQAALDDAGLTPEAIDGVLVATASADHVTPSTANLVQRRLGLRAVPTYDLNAGCTGGLYALITASSLIQAGVCQTLLVIGAEIVSRMVDLDDVETALVFGDGAGALVVQAGPEVSGDLRLLSHLWGSDGAKSDLIMVPAGGSRSPSSHQTVEQKEHFLRMNGSSVFRFAVRTLPMLVQEVLAKAGRSLADLSLLIPHQANWRIIDAAARKLSLDMSKIMVNIERYGNTSAASVLLALGEARQQGRLQPDTTVVLASFGAGLTWAAVALDVVA
jgi:3-oxoacyl-[acyl-carrier-protein] synthase-3